MTESNLPPSDPSSTPPPTVDYSSSPMSTAGGYTGPEPDKDAKMWGMLCHLSALVQFVGIPSIVGPLIVWLIKKNEIPFADDQGKEAVNFHITVMIAALVLTPTVCLAGLGVILLLALAVAAMVFSIIAAVKANNGIAYRYPLTLRLIK